MTLFSESLLGELATARSGLALARAKLYLGSSSSTLTWKQARSQGLPFPDPGPFRPTPGKDLVGPSLVASVTGAMDQLWQPNQAQDLILQGVPVIQDPVEDGDVDTILRLGFNPPAAGGRPAE